MKPRHSFSSSLVQVGRVVARVLREEDGTEAIEFALTAIPLFLFLFGAIEFGRLYWTQSELQYAVEAAARYVTINPSASTTTVKTYAASQVYGFSVPTGDFNVRAYDATLIPPAPACGNQVTVSYPFSFIVTGLFPYSIRLTATGCHLN